MRLSRLLILFCLVLLLSIQAFAQEATEPSIPPTSIATETPLPTATETSIPTATDLPTSTETATATEATTVTEAATVALPTEPEATQELTMATAVEATEPS
jgi:hypothetical protein